MITDFLKDFEKIAPEYDWELQSGVYVRGRRKDCDKMCCDMDYCPITAVVRSICFESFGVTTAPKEDVWKMTNTLTEQQEANLLISGADNPYSQYRQDILRITGLKDEPILC